MADIFLSYAREDQEHARRIAEALEAEGWSVFWDVKIRAGQRFAEFIERRLEESLVVVVLWSPHSVGSRWVKLEATHGLERETPALIPAMIARTTIPFEFRDIHAADLTSWLADNAPDGASGLDELLSAIDALAPSRVAASPAPAPVPAPAPTLASPGSVSATPSPPELMPTLASPEPMSVPRSSTSGVRATRGGVRTSTSSPRPLPDEIVVPLDPPLTLVKVPAGPFLMGSDKKKDTKASDDELWPGGAIGTVNVPEFYIGKFPVTVAQFKACVAAQGITPGNPKALGPHADHPVVYVSWSEALQYCQWLEQTARASRASTELMALLDDGWHLSLPSEAEWEKAARGTDGRAYPWGEGIDPQRANYSASNIGTTSAVGAFPRGASPYGAQDMSGNVWERTRSLSKPYPYEASDGREDLKANGQRVSRGGSFGNVGAGLRAAGRAYHSAGCEHDFIGFRVVVSRL